jgi:catechol 2,3-dioxygenase-like lactoylglutathione lyase family enzyme
MTLDGIHHLTTLTADVDRLIGFYERVFGARVTLDLEEEGIRHVFIEVGPNTVLHPFEVPWADIPQGPIPMFSRGRMDHFGLNAATPEAFWEVRRRVMDEGAGDGRATDMGPFLSFSFTDPDGAGHEVMLTRPGVPAETTLRRADWTTVPAT